jgi:hypothetical protein
LTSESSALCLNSSERGLSAYWFCFCACRFGFVRTARLEPNNYLHYNYGFHCLFVPAHDHRDFPRLQRCNALSKGVTSTIQRPSCPAHSIRPCAILGASPNAGTALRFPAPNDLGACLGTINARLFGGWPDLLVRPRWPALLAPLHRTSMHLFVLAPPAKLLGSGWARCLFPMVLHARLGNGAWWVVRARFRACPARAWVR